MAGHAGRQPARRIALTDQPFASGELRGIRLRRSRRRIRQRLAREPDRDLQQVGVGQVLHQVAHRCVGAASLPEMDQLVVQIARWLAGDPREIAFSGRPSFSTVAGGTGLHPSRHRIERACRVLRQGTRQAARSQRVRKHGACQPSAQHGPGRPRASAGPGSGRTGPSIRCPVRAYGFPAIHAAAPSPRACHTPRAVGRDRPGRRVPGQPVR